MYLRRCMGGQSDNSQNTEELTNKRDLRLTKISIVIVLIFAICHLPRFVPNVFEIFTNKNENMAKVFLCIIPI